MIANTQGLAVQNGCLLMVHDHHHYVAQQLVCGEAVNQTLKRRKVVSRRKKITYLCRYLTSPTVFTLPPNGTEEELAHRTKYGQRTCEQDTLCLCMVGRPMRSGLEALLPPNERTWQLPLATSRVSNRLEQGVMISASETKASM